ncbi:hypothetical protein FA10DRAFT_269369 [Acaromyces ingoldii]|uniref:Uncharacterized protein n=1 Tax=Acaromyces ingoldii TaxID=215250 RepID=A0A316YFM3_9BASI|nr:hypothetical protein FA10DRAFT_269369 [Acaromyces ingoldii]PWN87418.1 hypothetical protein FA10DRAFT_269369 [Acaromyces ingoldii]
MSPDDGTAFRSVGDWGTQSSCTTIHMAHVQMPCSKVLLRIKASKSAMDEKRSCCNSARHSAPTVLLL